MVSKEIFKPIVTQVIDKLEGGYYNPAWHSTGDSRYSSSGETMFGIDRKQAGTIDDTPEGKQFWSIIDKNKTPGVWKWLYRGGANEPKLKELAGDIIYAPFSRNWNKYITPQTSKIIEKDPRLVFHFAYATWNGPGWFKKFADDMNKAVASGVKDTNKLAQVAIDSRTKEGLKPGSSPNSLIAQGGNKIANLFTTMATSTADFVKKRPLLTISITIAVIVSGYVLYTQLKKK